MVFYIQICPNPTRVFTEPDLLTDNQSYLCKHLISKQKLSHATFWINSLLKKKYSRSLTKFKNVNLQTTVGEYDYANHTVNKIYT